MCNAIYPKYFYVVTKYGIVHTEIYYIFHIFLTNNYLQKNKYQKRLLKINYGFKT